MYVLLGWDGNAKLHSVLSGLDWEYGGHPVSLHLRDLCVPVQAVLGIWWC